MARWHRYHREERDYSHLDGKTAQETFAEALQERSFGHDIPTWPACVNRDLIAVFEGVERHTPATALEAYTALRIALGKRGQGAPDAFDGSVAGNGMAWGVHLGLLHQAEERRQFVWTMPDREPHYVAERGRAVKVRGLTDGEQADANRRGASLARRRATLRAKAAAALGPGIESNLNSILRWDPDYVIEAQGQGLRYSEADINASMFTYLPTLALPVKLVEVLPIVKEAHEVLEPRVQERWASVVARAARRARDRVEFLEKEAARKANLATTERLKAALDEADAAALGSLS